MSESRSLDGKVLGMSLAKWSSFDICREVIIRTPPPLVPPQPPLYLPPGCSPSTHLPDLPPSFNTTLSPPTTIPLSTALHIS